MELMGFLKHSVIGLLMGLSSVGVACAAEATPDKAKADVEATEEAAPPAPMPEIRSLRGMAPVSLVDSGLLDYLTPHLVRDTGIVVVWDKAGDTLGLELAKVCGSSDTAEAVNKIEGKAEGISVLLTETAAVESLSGHTLGSQEVMSDFLVLVGPAFDPAQAQGLELEEAMQAITRKRVPFASRGDGSAIHKREQAVWAAIGRDVRDGKNGYVEVGQGMIPTLNVAAAMQGYVLVDTPSFLLWSASSTTPLTVMVKNAPQLERKWSIVGLDPAQCPAAIQDADALARLTQDIQAVTDWWQKPATQKLIADYSREDRTIFRPALSTAEPEPAPKAAKKK